MFALAFLFVIVKNIVVNIIIFICHYSRCSLLLEQLYFTVNTCQVGFEQTANYSIAYSPNMFDQFYHSQNQLEA